MNVTVSDIWDAFDWSNFTLLVTPAGSCPSNQVLNVEQSICYPSIMSAHDAATAGDTLIAMIGTYDEDINIQKVSIAKVDMEPAMPAGKEIFPLLEISTFENWAAFSSWYSNLI